MNYQANIPLIEQVSATLRDMLGDEFEVETFWDTLDGETDAMDLIGQLIQRRVEADSHAAASKDMASIYSMRAKRLGERSNAINKALGQILDATGERKVAHPFGTVSRTKPRVNVNVFDDTAIPSQLCKVVTSPDKTAIKAQLDAGEDVPGAELVTGEPGVSVRIK